MWSETLRLLIVSLLSVSLSNSADVRTKYLRKAENSTLELDCSSLASSSATFSWQRNNELISSSSSLFEIEKSSSKLKILSGDKSEVFGNYSCRVGSMEVGKFRVVPMPLILLPKSKTVVEGETLELSCGEQIEGAARVIWVFANKTYEDSEGTAWSSREALRQVFSLFSNACFQQNLISYNRSIKQEDQSGLSCNFCMKPKGFPPMVSHFVIAVAQCDIIY